MAKKKITITPLENGLDFIVSAFEHLFSDDPKKEYDFQEIKYGILHLFSGIEIIFKARLAQEHWSLVFHDVNLAEINAYKNGSFQSVSFEESLKRLSSICKITFTKIDKEILDRIRENRNRINHFAIDESKETVLSQIFQAANFIVSFFSKNFKAETLSEKESSLLEEVHEMSGQCQRFVNERMASLKPQLTNAKIKLRCPSCLQEALIVKESNTNCLFCGYKDDPEKMADEFISIVQGENYYEIGQEGGEWPQYECPECNMKAMVFHQGNYICFNCAHQLEQDEMSTCNMCGEYFQDKDHEFLICYNCRKNEEIKLKEE